MTIAYIRTYSNKQQTESQKNAIEQFAKAKKTVSRKVIHLKIT